MNLHLLARRQLNELFSLFKISVFQAFDSAVFRIPMALIPAFPSDKYGEIYSLVFPIDVSSSGSCQIGGNISTNAGGTNVLKYGTTRSQVLGLEVVLPNGDIWNGMTNLIKDNSGYDLKQLFIGAEGTLGIITSATLKLYPCPGNIVTAFQNVLMY